MSESSTVEYKFKLNDSLEKEVVAFLNSETGGRIYIGVDDLGKPVGVVNVDSCQLQIKDRLKNNISPACLDFCSVSLAVLDGVEVVVLDVRSGLRRPYFLRRFGMCPSGCFSRVGSSCEPMSEEEISRLYVSRLKNTLTQIPSPAPQLTHRQLKIYYEGIGKPLNEQFLSTLQLLTPEGKPNYAAYLLSDSPQVFFRVAKYEGVDRVVLLESDEFGGCSLMKAFDMVFDRLTVENKTFAKITPKKREERRLIDSLALREAVLNAFVHNDYSYSATPKFEFFSDRLEITSAGGLPFGMSSEELFSGVSVPRNPELARVFRDLEYIEVFGSGVPRILRVYGSSAFEVSRNFIRVVLPFSKDEDGGIRGGIKNLPDADVRKDLNIMGEYFGESGKEINTMGEYFGDDRKGKILISSNERLVLSVVRESEKATYEEISIAVGLSPRRVEQVLARLKEIGVLERVGSKKSGSWKVLVADDELEAGMFVAEKRAEYLEGGR